MIAFPSIKRRGFEILQFQAKSRQVVGADHGPVGARANDKLDLMTSLCIRVHVDSNLFGLRADVGYNCARAFWWLTEIFLKAHFFKMAFPPTIVTLLSLSGARSV